MGDSDQNSGSADAFGTPWWPNERKFSLERNDTGRKWRDFIVQASRAQRLLRRGGG